ncbi:hypothetical protein LPJ66_003789, partial [Kickxella alabastrina]
MSDPTDSLTRGKFSISLEDSDNELDTLTQDIKGLSTGVKGSEQKKQTEEMKEVKAQPKEFIENETEVEVRLADIQADPNSPLYSIKSFEDL